MTKSEEVTTSCHKCGLTLVELIHPSTALFRFLASFFGATHPKAGRYNTETGELVMCRTVKCPKGRWYNFHTKRTGTI